MHVVKSALVTTSIKQLQIICDLNFNFSSTVHFILIISIFIKHLSYVTSHWLYITAKKCLFVCFVYLMVLIVYSDCW